MAKSPDYFLVDGNPPFTECPGLRERGAEIAKAQAEEAARKQAALDADLAVWNEKTIAPARAALATDVVAAARLIGRGFQGNRQSFSWEPEKEAATFIAAELKPKVDAMLAELPTSHGYADALAVLDEIGRACRSCEWVPPATTSTKSAWASFRVKNADALATAGSHGHAFVEYRYLADNGQAAAASKATAERSRYFAGHGLTVAVTGSDAASTEAARLFSETLQKSGRRETLVPGKADARVKVEVVVGPAKCGIDTSSSTRTASVTRGRKQVENEAYARARDAVEDAEKDIAKWQDDMEDTRKSSSCRAGSSGCESSLRSAQAHLDTARREHKNASERLRSIKPTREVDNVVEVEYPITVTTSSCRASLEVKTTVKGGPTQKSSTTISQMSEDYTTRGFAEGGVDAKDSADVLPAAALTAALPAASTKAVDNAVRTAITAWAKGAHDAAAKQKGSARVTAVIDAALAWPAATPPAHVELIARETGVDLDALQLERP